MRKGDTRAEQQLIAELCHQINSPLAAIRNALYLSAARSRDPELLRYLKLANSEISSIAEILRQARAILEEMTPPSEARRERSQPEMWHAAA